MCKITYYRIQLNIIMAIILFGLLVADTVAETHKNKVLLIELESADAIKLSNNKMLSSIEVLLARSRLASTLASSPNIEAIALFQEAKIIFQEAKSAAKSGKEDYAHELALRSLRTIVDSTVLHYQSGKNSKTERE